MQADEAADAVAMKVTRKRATCHPDMRGNVDLVYPA